MFAVIRAHIEFAAGILEHFAHLRLPRLGFLGRCGLCLSTIRWMVPLSGSERNCSNTRIVFLILLRRSIRVKLPCNSALNRPQSSPLKPQHKGQGLLNLAHFLARQRADLAAQSGSMHGHDLVGHQFGCFEQAVFGAALRRQCT